MKHVPIGAPCIDHARAGGLVVGLEPSCTAVFRADAAELLPEDLDVKRLQAQTVTLAELLTKHSPGWDAAKAEPLASHHSGALPSACGDALGQ